MRVGVVMNSLERGTALYAGGNVHMREVLRRLPSGLAVTVFAPGFARAYVLEARPRARFIAMPTFGDGRVHLALTFLARALLGCTRAVEVRRCEAVYAMSPFLPDVVPAAFARDGALLVCLFHLMDVPWRRGGSLARNVLAYLAERAGLAVVRMRARALVVGTALLARELRARGFRQPAIVTTCGVDAPTRAARPEADAPTRAGAVYVGRLHPAKGGDDLLAIWALVLRERPGEPLTIVGDGDPSYRAQLAARARALGMADCVRFLGAVGDAARDAALADAALFIFPSREEGWGIALAEAMAAGLPCATYALPVFAEVFPRGRLAAPRFDRAAFAANVVRLLGDDPLRATLGAEARALAASFTWDRAAALEGEVLVRLARRPRAS